MCKKKIIIHRELAQQNMTQYLIKKGYIVNHQNIYLNDDEFQIICFDIINNINILVSTKYQEKEVLNDELIESFIKQKSYLKSLIDNDFFKKKFNITGKWRIELYIFCKEGIEYISYISD